MFDLRKIFAVPKDFLKSKIYCINISKHQDKAEFKNMDEPEVLSSDFSGL